MSTSIAPNSESRPLANVKPEIQVQVVEASTLHELRVKIVDFILGYKIGWYNEFTCDMSSLYKDCNITIRSCELDKESYLNERITQCILTKRFEEETATCLSYNLPISDHTVKWKICVNVSMNLPLEKKEVESIIEMIGDRLRYRTEPCTLL